MVNNNLEQVLYRTHTQLLREIDGLYSNPSLSISALTNVHNRSLALLQEAAQLSPELHGKFFSEYETKLTELRLRARVQAMEVLQGISSLIRPQMSDPAPIGNYGSSGQIAPRQIQESSDSATNLNLPERLRPLVGSYVDSATIAKIAGYSTSNVYLRAKKADIKPKDRKYLMDEKGIAAFFGIRSSKQEIEEDGIWMTPKDIAAKYGYSTPTPVRSRLNDNPRKFFFFFFACKRAFLPLWHQHLFSSSLCAFSLPCLC